MNRELRAFVRHYKWIHTIIGLFGNTLFFVGSILFLWDSLMRLATWLFIVGSFGMLVGSFGTAVVLHEHGLRHGDDAARRGAHFGHCAHDTQSWRLRFSLWQRLAQLPSLSE